MARSEMAQAADRANLQAANVIRRVALVLQCPGCAHELYGPMLPDAWADLPSSIVCRCGTTVSVPEYPDPVDVSGHPDEGGRMGGVWDRNKTLHLFQRQLYALHSEIEGQLSKYVFQVRVQGRRYTACVEGYSHDYWMHRIDLHPLAKQVDLVVCYRHNSCVRQRVLELSSPTGREYDGFGTPLWFDLESRGGRAWAQVFQGALLAGSGAAYQELEKIREESPAAYYRYLARTAELSAHKWGRPAAV